MHSVREPEPHYLLVHQKLKGSFVLVYLTALCVIQGVALADLAFVVGTNSQQFTLTQWVLVLLTFGALIMTWHQYTMQIMSWDWIPDLRDTLLPFTIGALELLFNHLIPLSLSGWLLTLALISALGALGTWHTERQAGKEVNNLPRLTRLRRRLRLLRLYLFGLSLFLLLLALATALGQVQAAELHSARGVLALAIVLLVAAIAAGFCTVTLWYWRAVVAYAQTGYLPGEGQQVREAGQSPGDHQVLQQRLKDLFAPLYLTALSVIQGVALADLALVVAGHAQQFTLTHWLLVLLAFAVLLAAWSQFSMHATTWDWIPDLGDAIIPFGIGALELFLNHLIPLTLSGWLAIFTVGMTMSTLALWRTERRASQESENLPLLTRMRTRFHVLARSSLALAVLGLFLTVASQLSGAQASDGLQAGRGMLALGIVLLTGVGVIGFFIVTVWYWHAIIAYARTGHLLG